MKKLVFYEKARYMVGPQEVVVMARCDSDLVELDELYTMEVEQ